MEEIREKERQDGKWMYLVKWVGWDSDTNTWEPKEHLEDCKVSLSSNFSFSFLTVTQRLGILTFPDF